MSGLVGRMDRCFEKGSEKSIKNGKARQPLLPCKKHSALNSDKLNNEVSIRLPLVKEISMIMKIWNSLGSLIMSRGTEGFLILEKIGK